MSYKILCILGPTCTGKTDFSIKLAKILPIEIINIDSIMIYKNMTIGSAKPNKTILKLIKHHLINIKDPTENYSVMDFCKNAYNILKKFSKKKTLVFVGGNLMYMWTFQNIFIPNIKKCNINNLKYKFINIALMPLNKRILKKNIETRLNDMTKKKFIDEVYSLHKRTDLNINLNSINSIGYKDIWFYIENKIIFNNTKNSIIKNTMELSNKQLLWLKNWGENIFFFNSNEKNFLLKIKNLINNNFTYKRGSLNVLDI